MKATFEQPCVIFGILWIFGFSLSGTSTASNNLPAIIEQTGRDFTLGSCTWVFDRPCPDEDIKFYLFTRKNPHERQLVHIDETWEKSNLSDSNFSPYYPVKIIIHGYNSDMFLHPLISMKDEYLQRGQYNLLYVDWSVLAPGPCYFSAVHNARHAGKCIAQLIERVLEAGTANIHMIGFSLGAQVTNFVARNLGSFKVPRITGLDPAMPLFITADTDNKLDPSDAMFVDVIHTNALVQGKIERCGHADFYMNGGVIQPGCVNGGDNPFACSHHRAPDYFSESIRSYRGFWGWPCSSYINYLLGMCPPTNFLVLAGEDCRPETLGMFLITTSDSAPFALGKWTDAKQRPTQYGPDLHGPYTRHNVLSQQIDQWGKLDGSFNNIMHFPTPFSQDPNGGNWPYFGPFGTNEITGDMNESTTTNVRKVPQPDSTTAQPLRKHPVNLIEYLKKHTQTTNNYVNTMNSQNDELVEDQTKFLEDYKRNATLGFIDNSIFQVPNNS